jgi:23S rRNA pseudouridine2605 synthase|tara:strand:- start:272 stop:958 length:687 start_codon:yes stop_codon:yes gene_type:complete
MKTHRVQKLMSNYGYCSRRKAEELIEKGRVKVNGKLISLGDGASEDDKISVDGKIISKEKKVYVMLHKPINCITAVKDEKHKTVLDFINIKERVFPIGRLDYTTSGLLLLTNDGDFANKVMHPRYETKKSYLAKLNQEIQDFQVKELKKGIVLEDGKTRPASVVVHDKDLIEITIHEGKNRIIKRMLKALRINTLSLKRTKVGNLSLGKLKPGEFKILDKKELEKMFG